MTADASEVLKLPYMLLCILLAAGCVYALRKRKGSRLCRAALVSAALLFTAGAVFFGWLGRYYRADAAALAALSSRDTVTVEKISGGWRFDGPGEDTALIFYPGAKVEAAAYAPLLLRLAEGGADGFLLTGTRRTGSSGNTLMRIGSWPGTLSAAWRRPTMPRRTPTG